MFHESLLSLDVLLLVSKVIISSFSQPSEGDMTKQIELFRKRNVKRGRQLDVLPAVFKTISHNTIQRLHREMDQLSKLP